MMTSAPIGPVVATFNYIFRSIKQKNKTYNRIIIKVHVFGRQLIAEHAGVGLFAHAMLLIFVHRAILANHLVAIRSRKILFARNTRPIFQTVVRKTIHFSLAMRAHISGQANARASQLGTVCASESL